MDDHILKIGQTTLTESSGMSCVVGQYLGGGGQGEVYLAKLGDKPVALKIDKLFCVVANQAYWHCVQ